MPIVAEEYRFVAGVDTHARRHSLAIIEAASGRQVDAADFPATATGYARAANWLTRRCADPSRVLVSMEGTGSFGAKLRDHLTSRQFRVVEAPSPGRALRRRKGKSDHLDALRAAYAVLPLPTDRLTEAKAGEVITALRVLNAAREGMSRQRTAAINTLTALLRTVELGIDARKPLTHQQIQQVAAWRARREGVAARVSRTEAARLAKQVLQLEELLERNRSELNELVSSTAPGLLELTGVAAVTAAVILTNWSHPGRIHSEAAFAALAGTCPLPASSGNTSRHRLNRGGVRRLNRAIHTIAIVRMNFDARTKAYVAKRTAEGRSKKEIIRSLKRYITREVYKTMCHSMA